MKVINTLVLIAVLACISSTLHARQSNVEYLHQIDFTNGDIQSQSNIDNWLFQQRMEEAAERAEQRARFEAKERADEAEDLRKLAMQDAASMRNNIYLGIVILITIAAMAYFLIKKREVVMEENQKIGVLLVLGSVLFVVLAFMLSDSWIDGFDILQNLIRNLEINLFEKEDCTSGCYVISIPTKYVVFAGVCGTAYGLTTYLGITRFPPWGKLEQSNDGGVDIKSKS